MSRYCPICENFSEIFEPFGYALRADAMCPKCGSLERHRLSWLVIKEKPFDGIGDKKLLHIAPEEVFRTKFENLFGDNYLTADISGENVKIKMDITDIQYPDNTFDYIYCSHVLEHIVDDRKAMRELCRVLKKDGWAIILVPLYYAKEKTEEDFSITSLDDRMRLYGHPEHVRNYGKDFIERLSEAGWEVSMIQANDFLSNESIENMGITKAAGEIYFCRKV